MPGRGLWRRGLPCSAGQCWRSGERGESQCRGTQHRCYFRLRWHDSWWCRHRCKPETFKLSLEFYDHSSTSVNCCLFTDKPVCEATGTGSWLEGGLEFDSGHTWLTLDTIIIITSVYCESLLTCAGLSLCPGALSPLRTEKGLSLSSSKPPSPANVRLPSASLV